MNHRSLKIAIFCFLWGFTGTLVALQVHPYFWWIGMLAGVFGYITWVLKEVIRAIPLAWRKATSWKANREWWKGLGCCLIYSFIFTGSISALVCISFFAILIVSEMQEMALAVKTMISLWFGVSFFITLMPIAIYFDPKRDREILKNVRQLAREINLLTICFKHIPRGAYLLAIHLIVFIPFVVKVIWIRILKAITTISRFIYHLFRLIHSEERLLIGMYIASGVAIGYLVFRNAIVGGLVAGGLAYAAREIISKRILKVIPLRNGS